MKKRLVRLGISLVVVSAVALGLQTAQAVAADRQSCGSWFCVYTSPGQSGDIGKFHVGAADLANFKNGYLQDNIESVYNNTGSWVRIYENNNYCGEFMSIAPGRSTSNLGDLTNSVSSIQVGTGSGDGNANCDAGRVTYSNRSDSSNSESSYSDSSNYDSSHSNSCGGDVRVYTGAGRSGHMGTFTVGSHDLLQTNPDLQDNISSIDNTTNCYVDVYTAAEYCGTWVGIPPHRWTNLNATNDQISSIKVNGHSGKGTLTCNNNNGASDNGDNYNNIVDGA